MGDTSENFIQNTVIKATTGLTPDQIRASGVNVERTAPGATQVVANVKAAQYGEITRPSNTTGFLESLTNAFNRAWNGSNQSGTSSEGTVISNPSQLLQYQKTVPAQQTLFGTEKPIQPEPKPALGASAPKGTAEGERERYQAWFNQDIPAQGLPGSARLQAAYDRANTAVYSFDALVKQQEENPTLRSDPAFQAKLEAAGLEMRNANTELTQAKAAEKANGTGENTAQREVQCPVCTGSILIRFAGRVFSTICGWIGKAFNIRAEIIDTIKNYVIERLPVSKRTLFKEGKCGACEGKGTITDVTDDRAKQAQAASIAQSKAKEIEENEAKLGTGGNEFKIVSGHVVHEVGLGMNDVASYRQEPDKGARLKGMGIANGVLDEKAGAMPIGGKRTVTVGTNPIASPGGQYCIKCSNKFSLLTGALGVEITTGGPITIKGGITRITGPEISIGTQTGTLGLEGEVVNIVGKSIEVGPKDGDFIVKGSGGCTAQWTVGGNLHAESASIVKLETVGRNEPSKISASTNLFSGPAFWGGKTPEGLKAALQELLGFVTSHVTNAELAKYIVSPRYADNLLDNEINIAYMTQPTEPFQTGVAVGEIFGIGLVCLPVYNFPHIHANFDQPHYHETRVPDIDCTAENAKELRAKQVGQNTSAPMHKKSASFLDVLRSFWSAIGYIFIPIWYPISRNIQSKILGGKNPCP